MDHWIECAESLFGLKLNARQSEQFQQYMQILLEWNTKINLTAIRQPDEIVLKHFLDSLSVAKAWLKAIPPASLVDIGSGAGFPGIPLKILWPEMKLTLVDSVAKKMNFCLLVADALQLDGVQVLTSRAEELGQNPQHREKYHLVTARAVAAMPTLLEYTLPLAKPGGCVILQKGESAPAEAQNAKNIIHKLGGDLKGVLPVEIPGIEGARYLLRIDKNARTPQAYPRRTGIPAKSPLSQ
ncbi:MAG: 16S rRNA (guanine(527)-N(7))-methyltransferase RsmG [Anaerolineaceae bacterium]|nr:16S rRNA (guanine(527)-N(7))-methyltransferase RsmG [Anaerolineaceae bacterium]